MQYFIPIPNSLPLTLTLSLTLYVSVGSAGIETVDICEQLMTSALCIGFVIRCRRRLCTTGDLFFSQQNDNNVSVIAQNSTAQDTPPTNNNVTDRSAYAVNCRI